MRAGALGDLLLLRPAIAALARAGRKVTLLAPSGPAAALLGSGPGDVASVLPWEAAAFAGLHADDGAVDQRTAARLRTHHAAIVYSRDRGLARNLGRYVGSVAAHDPAPPPGGPHAAEWLASCVPSQGLAAASDFPVLRLSADEDRQAAPILAVLPARFLAIHPGSGSPVKNWPPDRFASLARAAAPEKWLLVRGPADDAAAGALEGVPGRIVARDLPLRVLAAVLARAGCYVGNDSGVTHLAAATGAPAIALFGATDPALWAPLGPRVEIIAARTMEAIPMETVAAAVSRAR